jgi:glycosyltransferase involved in cell wall biosynthesis
MWPERIALDVIGDGNLDKSRYINNVNINFLGKVSRKEVLELLPKYKGMIFTSSSPESALPLVVLESIALGLPIITTDNNTVSDAVREGNFGAILPANYIKRDLEFCIEQIESNYEDLSIKAQNYSNLHHDFRSWMNAYNSSYKQVIEEWKNNKYNRGLQ